MSIRRPPDALPAAVGYLMPDGILIVDDHVLTRVAVRLLLERDGLDVCGEASGGLEATQKARELAPAIVLLDVNMPWVNGLQAAIEIRRIAPAAKIVFFTFHRGPRIAEAVLAYGDAFVSKSDASTELVPTIRRLMAAGQPTASAPSTRSSVPDPRVARPAIPGLRDPSKSL